MTASTRFDTLDAIRGLAALVVVFRHTTAFGDTAPDSHSYLAVDLFFVLSGFVVAHAYDRGLVDGSVSTARFFVARLIRLYPLLLLSVVVAAGVALTAVPGDTAFPSYWAQQAPGPADVLLSSLLAMGFMPSIIVGTDLLFPLNTALWSLMFELVVNLMYAMLCVRLSTRALCGVVVACGLGFAVFALRRDGIDWGWAWGVKSLGPGLLRAAFGFGLGVMLLRTYARNPLVSVRWPAAAVLALAVLPLLVPRLAHGNGWVDLLAVTLVFPIAIVLGTGARLSSAARRAAVLLGAVSYPIYVLHVPALRLLERLLTSNGWEPGPFDAPRAIVAGLFLTGLFVIAIALDLWFDRPVRAALAARLRRLDLGGLGRAVPAQRQD